MKLIITSKNVELTDSIKSLFEKKAAKLERYLKPDTELRACFVKERSREIVELTIPLEKGATLRAEETGYDFYAGIDAALAKLERQIFRHKKRAGHRLNSNAFSFEEPVYAEELPQEAEEDSVKVVRTKRFSVKPMDVQEAIAQMEMLGHNFFVYQDVDTSSVNVVYKRMDGDYGVIEPELD